jgi:hypothetical protein
VLAVTPADGKRLEKDFVEEMLKWSTTWLEVGCFNVCFQNIVLLDEPLNQNLSSQV